VRTLGWIALNGFRESVRDKVMYSLVAFAVLLMGTSYLLGQLTAGQDLKIMKDMGLSSIAVFGLFMAVFIGIGLVSKEVERRSIYGLLAKPIRRYELVLGKYAGLVLTLAVNFAIMTVALYAVLAWVGWHENESARLAREAPALDPALLKAIALTLVQMMIVTATALFFSTFSTPILSAALTFGFYVAGYFSADLRNFDQVVDSKVVQVAARGLYYVLPNLGPFDVTEQVVHGLPVGWHYLAATIGYGVVYIAMLLVASITIFSRRDFK
jgi:ABC-type transport system involved in multi-copper enzyme maturation permease subunit